MRGSTLVVIVSDLHVNSVVGLCPGQVRREAGIFKPGRPLRWSLSKWQAFWQRVADYPAARKVCVVLGDAVDINQHDRGQLIEYENQAIILDMAEQVLQLPRTVCEDVLVVRGTAAHTGGAGYLEEQLAQRIGAAPDEVAGTASWWHLPLRVEDVLFDLQHHPQTSGYRPWTKDAAAGRQAAITFDEYGEDRRLPPDIVGRAHVHQWSEGYSRGTYGFFCPPWQLTTTYGHRIGHGSRVEPIGGVVFECLDGSWERWKDTRYAPSRRQAWTSRKQS